MLISNYKSFITIFEDIAKDNNEAALICDDKKLTFTELNEISNKYANYFLSQGVTSGDIVGVCLERNIDMLPSLIGLLKIGAAYVPLDPNFPVSRIEYMVNDIGLNCIISQTNYAGIFDGLEKENILTLDTAVSIVEMQEKEIPDILIPGDSPAYIIYTSGSTGNPKGVQTQHEALLNCLLSMKEKLGILPDDRFLALTTLSFDPSALELFLPLISGVTIILAKSELKTNPISLIEFINKYNATIIQATPVTYQMLLDAEWKNRSIKKILSGGEVLTKEMASFLLEQTSEVWNVYGPTETTIWATLYKVSSEDRKPLIGKPIDNASIHIFDESLKPVSVGDVGELFIGGKGVSLGYWNRPELNSERFLNLRLEDGSIEQVYKTGDLCCLHEDGNLEYIGRSDFQVKIRGFRIELGEIESALIKDPAVHNAVVVAKETAQGRQLLVAYIIPEENEEFLEVLIKKSLLIFLPNYMIPNVFKLVDEYPLTPNGKIDRKFLSQMDIEEGDCTEAENLFKDIDESDLNILRKIESVLGQRINSLEHSFVDLGGDSLSYIRVSLHLEKHLGYLPSGWEKKPLKVLFNEKSKKSVSNIWSSIEIPILLRAVAITFVVFSHLGITWQNGALVLFVLSGISYGKFLRPNIFQTGSLKGVLRFILRYGIPAGLWQLLRSFIFRRFWFPDIILLGTMFQKPGDGHWTLWFLDILTACLLIMSVFSLIEFRWRNRIIKPDSKGEYRFRTDFIILLLTMAGTIFQVSTGWWNGIPGETSVGPFRWLWLIAFGTAISEVTGNRHRILLSGVLLLTLISDLLYIPILTPSFGWYDALFYISILLTIWVGSFRIPKIVKPVIVEIAAASLFIYIINIVVITRLLPLIGITSFWPVQTTAVLIVGIIVYRMWNIVLKIWAKWTDKIIDKETAKPF